MAIEKEANARKGNWEFSGTDLAGIFSMYWTDGFKSPFGETFPTNLEKFWKGVFEKVGRDNPYSVILDIGTGNGLIPLMAREESESFDLVGIDFAKVPPPSQEKRIDIQQMNAEDLKFPDGSFDLVTSNFGIEYTKMDIALKEAIRVLRPGGRTELVLHHPESKTAKNMQVAAGLHRELERRRILPEMENFLLSFKRKRQNKWKTFIKNLESQSDDDYVQAVRLSIFNEIARSGKSLEQLTPESLIDIVKKLRQRNMIGYKWAEFYIGTLLPQLPKSKEEAEALMSKHGFTDVRVSRVSDNTGPLGWTIEAKKAW